MSMFFCKDEGQKSDMEWVREKQRQAQLESDLRQIQETKAAKISEPESIGGFSD